MKLFNSVARRSSLILLFAAFGIVSILYIRYGHIDKYELYGYFFMLFWSVYNSGKLFFSKEIDDYTGQEVFDMLCLNIVFWIMCVTAFTCGFYLFRSMYLLADGKSFMVNFGYCIFSVIAIVMIFRYDSLSVRKIYKQNSETPFYQPQLAVKDKDFLIRARAMKKVLQEKAKENQARKERESTNQNLN